MQQRNEPVFDVAPWPNGQGFTGGSEYWETIRTKDEDIRLSHMLLTGLMNSNVREQLLSKHDHDVYARFGIPEQVQQRLQAAEVDSVEELAEALLAAR